MLIVLAVAVVVGRPGRVQVRRDRNVFFFLESILHTFYFNFFFFCCIIHSVLFYFLYMWMNCILYMCK